MHELENHSSNKRKLILFKGHERILHEKKIIKSSVHFRGELPPKYKLNRNFSSGTAEMAQPLRVPAQDPVLNH